MERGYTALTRRERLERIAAAERDRRAGRVEVAVAALGEASEWPARVVFALARLSESEGAETRQILEEGLDAWVNEIGLAPLDEAGETPALAFGGCDNGLERPIETSELDRAFAEAEAQTDEMHDVNRVAEHVLTYESETDAPLVEEWEAMAPVEVIENADSGPQDAVVLATLERWSQNLEASRLRGVR